jgi:uncharacterized protein (TIGR02099 family)
LLAGLLAGVLITAALLLGALRLALALVPENATRLQQWVEQQTRLRVEFAGIDARLRWFGPEIVLRDVRVLDENRSDALFQAREGAVALDLWGLFRTGELVAGRVRLVGPAVTIVRLADGRIRLLGQRERPQDHPPFELERLPAGRVEIESAAVSYRDLKTGRGPWTLEQVQLVLQREHDAVQLSGSGRLPDQLGSSIDFSGWLRGSLDRLADVDARLSMSADRLVLAGFADFLPAWAARPTSGEGPVSVVLRVAQGRLDQLRIDVELANVRADLRPRDIPPIAAVEISRPYRAPGASPLSMPLADQVFVDRPAPAALREARYESLAGRLRLRRDGDLFNFRASGLKVRRAAGEPLLEPAVSGSWRGHPASAFGLNVTASRIDLGALWPLVLATAPAGFDRWAGLQPAGEVRELRADVVRERAGSEPRFAVSADLLELSAEPSGRWPGVAGITATLSGTDQRGRIALHADAPSLEWPRMFREPIVLSRAVAELDWRREGRDWVLAAPEIVLSHPQASVQGGFELRLDPGLRSPVLVLDAQVEQLDATLVSRVLPAGRLKPRTIAWLDRAFPSGRASNGRVSYRGPVRRFPFRNGEGEFIASADVSGVRLDYFDGFAPLTAAAGKIEFRNASLRADVVAGSVGGLRLRGATLAIADLKAPVLEIGARASGNVAAALAVLQGSPLGPRLGTQFMQVSAQGPADFDLRLELATGDAASRDYTVRTAFRSVSVALPSLRAPASGVTGNLEIHNLDVRADALRGTILDGPFELTVRPGPVSSEVTASVLLSGRGRAGGAGLPKFIGLPGSIRMTGGADWQLDGRLERRGAGEPWPARFEVTSDLRGLEVAAPRPFAKRAAEARPTRVALSIARPGRNDVRIDSGSARAILAFAARDGGRWSLERGAARFDGRPISLPSRPGLHVTGDWPEFDLAEWLTLRSPSGGGQRLSEWLGPVDVHLDTARVLGFEFSDVTARLQPLDRAWRIDVSGPMAEGRVSVPVDFKAGEPLQLDMQRLRLKAAPKRGEAQVARETDPRDLPAITVRAGEFAWQGRQFGRLQAELRKDPQGLRLTSFGTQSPAFELTGTGTWLAEPAGSRTRLALEFSSADLAAASRALGYRESVDASEARVRANLTWSGGPAEDALARMDGTLRLELGQGQLRGVKPGAGRMLGLISVVELPRRLSLDFRDVTEEGLAFDTVQGDFEIRAGNAYTQNLLLKGATVDIGVVGRTGLAAQDYEQTVVVSGSPSGPITVAGALAAGPVGAAGALLFSQLFKGQLQGLARIYYRVTGSWSNPTVERISATAGSSVADGTQQEKRP